MASEQTIIAVSGAITTVLPSVVALIKALFIKQNPNTPPPTDAEILLAFSTACTKSIAMDDMWLATHPKE